MAPLLKGVTTLCDAACAAGVPIVVVYNAFPWYSCLNVCRRWAAARGSPGARIDPRVALPPGGATIPVAKPGASAFSSRAFSRLLAGQPPGPIRLFVAGVKAGGRGTCVRATAADALARGHAVVVAADAVAADSRGAREDALNAIARRGATVVATANEAAAMMRGTH